VSLETQNLK